MTEYRRAWEMWSVQFHCWGILTVAQKWIVHTASLFRHLFVVNVATASVLLLLFIVVTAAVVVKNLEMAPNTIENIDFHLSTPHHGVDYVWDLVQPAVTSPCAAPKGDQLNLCVAAKKSHLLSGRGPNSLHLDVTATRRRTLTDLWLFVEAEADHLKPRGSDSLSPVFFSWGRLPDRRQGVSLTSVLVCR